MTDPVIREGGKIPGKFPESSYGDKLVSAWKRFKNLTKDIKQAFEGTPASIQKHVSKITDKVLKGAHDVQDTSPQQIMVSNPRPDTAHTQRREKPINASDQTQKEKEISYILRMKGQVGEPVAKKQPKVQFKTGEDLEMTKIIPASESTSTEASPTTAQPSNEFESLAKMISSLKPEVLSTYSPKLPDEEEDSPKVINTPTPNPTHTEEEIAEFDNALANLDLFQNSAKATNTPTPIPTDKNAPNSAEEIDDLLAEFETLSVTTSASPQVSASTTPTTAPQTAPKPSKPPLISPLVYNLPKKTSASEQNKPNPLHSKQEANAQSPTDWSEVDNLIAEFEQTPKAKTQPKTEQPTVTPSTPSSTSTPLDPDRNIPTDKRAPPEE